MIKALSALLLAACASAATPPLVFSESARMQQADGTKTVTYKSQALSLLSGGVANTDAWETVVPMPSDTEGDISIMSLTAQLVDEDGPVSLRDVYLHHFVFYQSARTDPDDDTVGMSAPVFSSTPCLGYSFGVGSEVRNSAVVYSNDFYQPSLASTVWGANVHAIRTSGVPDELVKDCIECRCWPFEHGAISCCPDGSLCKGGDDSMPARDFFLEYTVTYKLGLGDASKSLTPYVVDYTPCQTEATIPKSDGTTTTQTDTRTWPVQRAGDIVFAAPHVHIGANYMNMTLLQKATGKEVLVCEGIPVYGTGNATDIGNEGGYIVAIPPCDHSAAPISMALGDTLMLEVQYQNVDPVTGEPMWHGGVMGLGYMAIAEGGRQMFEVLKTEGTSVLA